MAEKYLKVGTSYVVGQSNRLVVIATDSTIETPPLEIGVPGTAGTVALSRGISGTFTLTASGGTPPYTWALVAPNNTLPSALSLNASTGVISGIPAAAGSTAIVARATDTLAATGTSGTITIAVAEVPALQIATPALLSNGEEGTPYTRTFQSTGGWPVGGARTWTKTSGDYPDGLTLNGATGVLSGVPTEDAVAAGTSVFTLQVADDEGRTDSRTFSITVVADGGVEGPHDYWNELVADPTHFQSYSLRSQEQINSLSPASVNTQCQYLYDIPGADTGADPQDAMKVTIPGGETVSGLLSTNIIYIGRGQYGGVAWNLGVEAADTVLLVWDQLWEPSFRDNCGNVTHIKSVGIQMNNGTWWTLMQSPGPGRNATDPTSVGIRADVITGGGTQVAPRTTTGDWVEANGNHVGGWEWAEGCYDIDNFAPTGPGAKQQRSYTAPWPVTYQSCAHMKQNMWMRYIIEIRTFQPPSAFTDWNAYIAPNQVGETPHVLTANDRHPSGTWHMVSAWVYREDGTIDRTMFRVPVGYGLAATPLLTSMRFTMDSSKHGTTGEMVGYTRNFVMLKNYELPEVPEEDTFIFRRPVR
jgi:hypothetical protein